jgi:hypothetical protein
MATPLVDRAPPAQTPLENPNVVLIMIRAANLFSRSKAPSRIEQFVPKRDLHLTVRTLGSWISPTSAGHLAAAALVASAQ